jgi:benzoylformate decarboxylase
VTTVRAATHELLRAFGMTTVFGNPGSTELRFFKDADALRYVLCLQEASAVAMADGYAQATGNAAFVNLHSAVGVGHALGSVFTAMRNRAPLVITAGQQTRAMLPLEPFLFSEEAAQLPKPYVKWSGEPARAEDVPLAIARAYHLAMQPPRGPTFVSVPEDDWDVELTGEPVVAREVHAAFRGDPSALGAVAAALAASARPAVVVGPGVDRDGAWDAVVELVERIGAAVWVSPLSSRCSFPEDHPAFAGFLVPERRKLAAQLAPHDVVLVLGAPVFTYHVHADGPFVAEGTQLLQLVDDATEAARAPVGTAVLTTLRPGVEEVLAALGSNPGASGGRAGPTVRPGDSAGRVRAATPEPSDPMTGAYVLAALDRLLPEDAIVVEEAPSHRNALHEHLPIRRPGSFFNGASGGLGWALPAAVGIGLGQPGRRVLCLVGDGSSLYSIQALWTAAQLRLPITFVVLNNGGYVALKALGLHLGVERPPGVDLPGLDLVAIAEGFGCAGRRVERAALLEKELRAALADAGPTLLDVPVDGSVQRLY